MQELNFSVSNQKLSATVFYPKTKKDKNPAILFVHGWTSEKERSYQYAKSLSDLGFICFLFDMRGHGKSEGDIETLTIRQFREDVLAAYDYLKTLDVVEEENVSAVGSSFGGYLIALLSEKRKVKNLAMRVPCDYNNEDFNKSKYETSGKLTPSVFTWRNKPKKVGETFALTAIHNFNGNILIMEAEKDDTVPHQTIVNYINAVKDKNKLTHKLMKGAPHSASKQKDRDQIEKILVDWFKDKNE